MQGWKSDYNSVATRLLLQCLLTDSHKLLIMSALLPNLRISSNSSISCSRSLAIIPPGTFAVILDRKLAQ